MLASSMGDKTSEIMNIADSVKTEENVVVTDTKKREETENTVNDTESTELGKLNTTKEIVEEYFKDIPIMVDVAYCESRHTQFNSDGSVLRGVVNPADVGVMQINEKYHLETSIKLGIDIHTLEGNMAYGRYLYETQGTRPWEYSSHCWNKSREVAMN
jgi:hypothetical protein